MLSALEQLADDSLFVVFSTTGSIIRSWTGFGTGVSDTSSEGSKAAVLFFLGDFCTAGGVTWTDLLCEDLTVGILFLCRPLGWC